VSSETSTSSVFNEIVQLLKEGKVYLAKLKKIMESHKIKKGIKRYPRFIVRLPLRFIETHGLGEGDLVYVLPAYSLNHSKNNPEMSYQPSEVIAKIHRSLLEQREVNFQESAPSSDFQENKPSPLNSLKVRRVMSKTKRNGRVYTSEKYFVNIPLEVVRQLKLKDGDRVHLTKIS